MTTDQLLKYLRIAYAAGNEAGGGAPAEGASTTGEQDDKNDSAAEGNDDSGERTAGEAAGSNNNENNDAAKDGAEDQGDGNDQGGVDQSRSDNSQQPASPQTPVPAWVRKQIDRQHRREQQLKEERDHYKELATRATGGHVDGDEGVSDAEHNSAPRQVSDAGPDATVEQRARDLVAQREFQSNLNSMYRTGTEKIGETFKQSIENLKLAGGIDADTMSAILAADDPAKIVHELGQNPDKLEELQELPFAQRVTKIVKMGLPPAPIKKKTVSNAPAPVDEVNARQSGDQTSLSDQLPADEWHRRRQQQRKERYEAKQAGRA